jgi:hypothetical protein
MAPSPRVVRNFYVIAEVDGRRSRISGGPRAWDGGMTLTLYQRRSGSVAAVLTLRCGVRKGNELVTDVECALPECTEATQHAIHIKTGR